MQPWINSEYVGFIRNYLQVPTFHKSILNICVCVCLKLNYQEEHMEIRSKRKSGSNLTWSEVNNMPYTAKVSMISCI